MNIIDLPRGEPKPGSAEALRRLIDEMTEKLPQLLELEAIQAQIKRKRFLMLTANGFTEAQALELCKT